MNSLINRNEFAEAIKRRLTDEKLTQKEAAASAGVHPSTFSRIVQGDRCKFVNFARICDWLGCPPERYMDREILKASGNVLENIKEIIHADPHLSNEDKDRLWHLFEAMYGSLTKKETLR